MAAPEHINLSTYIKNVHINLRKRSREMGYETAWKDHCKNKKILDEYASSMKKLATEHWDQNAKENSKVISRITWVYECSQKYFNDGDLQKQRSREEDVLKKLEETAKKLCSLHNQPDCIKLLDVGSCYNPFKKYNCFEVIAIDIAPSSEDVYQCDFLNVLITEENRFDCNKVVTLKRNSFNVIVFSLLLEYLPSPKQRLECCQSAYNLLDYEGLLIIITPDSKHVGANAKYMKSWRFVLSLIGFSRIKYEKLPYLHCMIFRKCINIKFSERWAKMHENDGLDNKICIPQDFQDGKIIVEQIINKEKNISDNLDKSTT